MYKNKNSDKLELNQRPKDNRATLQSSALPAELLSESDLVLINSYKSVPFHKIRNSLNYLFMCFLIFSIEVINLNILN